MKKIRLDFKELIEEFKTLYSPHQYAINTLTVVVYSPLFLFWVILAQGVFPDLSRCGPSSHYASMIGMLFYPILQGVVANVFRRSEQDKKATVLGALGIGYSTFLFVLAIGVFDALLSFPLYANRPSDGSTENLAFSFAGIAFTILVGLPLSSILMVACCVSTIEKLGVLDSIKRIPP